MSEWILQYLYLPQDLSSHGHELDALTGWVHLLMLILFVGWGIFYILTIFKFNKKRNPNADYKGVKTHISSYLEVGVAVIEAVLLVGFSIPLWANVVENIPEETAKDVVTVRVVAEQFAWNIHYPGPDGKFGKTAPELVDLANGNPLGIDSNDPNAADDITTVNQLNVPMNKQILVKLTSKDVIHSFFLPEMRVKQDAIPGSEFPVKFTVVSKGDNDGKYEIACAQLCGLGHYRMRGYFNIMTQEEFDAWMVQQQELLKAAGEDDGW